MRELALHLLDIAENSAAADAKTIRIEVVKISPKTVDHER